MMNFQDEVNFANEPLNDAPTDKELFKMMKNRKFDELNMLAKDEKVSARIEKLYKDEYDEIVKDCK